MITLDQVNTEPYFLPKYIVQMVNLGRIYLHKEEIQRQGGDFYHLYKEKV